MATPVEHNDDMLKAQGVDASTLLKPLEVDTALRDAAEKEVADVTPAPIDPASQYVTADQEPPDGEIHAEHDTLPETAAT